MCISWNNKKVFCCSKNFHPCRREVRISAWVFDRLRSVARSLSSDCETRWGTVSFGKSGSILEHEDPGSSSGELLVGSSSCTVNCWGGLGIGRKSSCSTGLRAEGIFGVNYVMCSFWIMAIYFCYTKVTLGKMILLFSPHHRDCERHWLVDANEPAT